MNNKKTQIYCNDEYYINEWLSKNKQLEIVDIKMSGTQGEFWMMVIYKVGENDVVN